MSTKNVKAILFVCTIVLFAASSYLCAEVIVLNPTDDTFIDEFSPGSIRGAQPQLVLRRVGLTGWELHTLLKFDLSSIPAGTTINSATINLYYFQYLDCDPVGNPLNVYRITEYWDEETTTWNNSPAYDSTVISSVDVPAEFGWVQWDVTDSVQDFVDGNETNYGWQIMDVATSDNCMTYFHSKEYVDSNEHPYLEIDAECTGSLGYHQADINRDCYVNMLDLALLANQWLWSSDPCDPEGTPGDLTFIGAGFAFDGDDEIGPARILFLYDSLNEDNLEPNDIILEYSGNPVNSGQELLEVIKNTNDVEPGQTVQMAIQRGMDVIAFVAKQDLYYSLGLAGWQTCIERLCVKTASAGGQTSCACQEPSEYDCWHRMSEIVVHKSPYAQSAYMSMTNECYNKSGTTIFNQCQATAEASTVMLVGK